MSTPDQPRTSDIDWDTTWHRADVLWAILADRLGDTPERKSIASDIYEPLLHGLLALRPQAASEPSLRAALETAARRLVVAAEVVWIRRGAAMRAGSREYAHLEQQIDATRIALQNLDVAPFAEMDAALAAPAPPAGLTIAEIQAILDEAQA